MTLLGPAALRVLINRLVLATPIISKIVAYVEQSDDGADAIVIHTFSDCGEKDKFVEKLLQKALGELDEAFMADGYSIPDCYRIAQSCTRDTARVWIPFMSQIVYVRVD